MERTSKHAIAKRSALAGRTSVDIGGRKWRMRMRRGRRVFVCVNFFYMRDIDTWVPTSLGGGFLVGRAEGGKVRGGQRLGLR